MKTCRRRHASALVFLNWRALRITADLFGWRVAYRDRAVALIERAFEIGCRRWWPGTWGQA